MKDTLKHAHVVRDSLFGIILPILCLVVDPFLFRDGLGLTNGGALLGSFQVFAYLTIGLCILTLALWLWIDIHAPMLLSVLAGIFAIGAVLAGVLALGLAGTVFALRPLLVSRLTMPVIAIPVVAVFVYLRHARIATHRARTQLGTRVVAGVIGVSLVLVTGVPALFQIATSALTTHVIDTIVSGEEPDMQWAVTRLRIVRIWCPYCADGLVRRYRSEPDPAHCERLAAAYHAVTGGTIDDRMPIDSDGRGYSCEDRDPQ